MENRDKIALLEQRHKFTWKTNLAEAIKAGNKGFDLVRYIHEGRGEKFEFYLGALPDMLGLVAIRLRPDWQEMVEKAAVRAAEMRSGG